MDLKESVTGSTIFLNQKLKSEFLEPTYSFPSDFIDTFTGYCSLYEISFYCISTFTVNYCFVCPNDDPFCCKGQQFPTSFARSRYLASKHRQCHRNG